APDKINQSSAHKVEPLAGIIEQFAHGNRRGALLAQYLEIANVFRREGVLEEEQPVSLQFLCQANRVDGRKPLMHVMEQLDLFAEMLAQIAEKFWDSPAVGRRLEQFAREVAFPHQPGRGVRF